MNVVRCNDCGWVGREEELTIRDDEERCPQCDAAGCLMDVYADCNLDDEQLIELWNMYSEVSINDEDEIEQEFIGFPVGTNRFVIWEWFDEHYSRGVYSLAYNAGQ